ncbi:hypothetical protein B296_00056467 [Ensete ventricosum]|uniref:Uncharacterized protein n=1 Tax=Ensete ventricosum TaxID=4639 RepID=A0A426XVQ9_ENSVE|nr:hypothetical protein B296_00056467 [Ensete ventricosum]
MPIRGGVQLVGSMKVVPSCGTLCRGRGVSTARFHPRTQAHPHQTGRGWSSEEVNGIRFLAQFGSVHLLEGFCTKATLGRGHPV